MKFILSLMMLIACIFLAQSAFAMDVKVQEALNPPDTFMVVSAISAPTGQSEFIYEASTVVTLSVNALSHLNSYIVNKSDETLIMATLILESHFKEVETVLKFPYLIQANRLKENHILAVGLVS